MPARAAASVLLMLAAWFLGGCQEIVDTERLRVCRIAMAAVNPIALNFRIASASAPAPDQIDIAYWPAPPHVTSMQRRISCRFENAGPADPHYARLLSVVADRVELPATKLWIITRYWVPAGRDPAPMAATAIGPELSYPFAVGLQQILSGLPQIAIYALLASAYALLYGLIGRVNLAFGEFAMLAGYGAFLGFAMAGGASGILVAALAAALMGFYTSMIHGALFGAGIFAPLMRAPGQHVLVASVGLAIFLQEYMRLAQGTGLRWVAPLFTRPLTIAHAGSFTVTITLMALIVSVVALAATACTVLMMRFTRFGRAWRATADDSTAAAMLGIDPHALVILTFLIASALAGLAGYVMLIFYGGVGYAGGTVLGLKALLAAVLGGISSVPGAVLGALALGIGEALWSTVFKIEYRDAFVFTALAVMLVLRPAGLFGVRDEAPRHRLP